MSETYSFLSLRELIDAKIERRRSLLHAVEDIDREFAEALEILTAHERKQPLVRKVCARCPKEFEGRKGRLLCRDCMLVSHHKQGQDAQAGRLEKAIDVRLRASGAVT